MIIKLHNSEFTKTWRVSLSRRTLLRRDNGHLFSIGLILGEDVKPSTLKQWLAKGIAIEVPNDNGGAW